MAASPLMITLLGHALFSLARGCRSGRDLQSKSGAVSGAAPCGVRYLSGSEVSAAG